MIGSYFASLRDGGLVNLISYSAIRRISIPQAFLLADAEMRILENVNFELLKSNTADMVADMFGIRCLPRCYQQTSSRRIAVYGNVSALVFES